MVSLGVWTILNGAGSEFTIGITGGPQRAGGGVVRATVARFSYSALSSGRSGDSSGLTPARTLKKERGGGSSPRPFAPPGRIFISSLIGAPSPCQTPDRSGLPLEARGAGADKLGLPSLVRGAPGSRVFSHCAWTPAVNPTSRIKMQVRIRLLS